MLPTVVITPTPTLLPELKGIWEAWEGSLHADTYNLEKGPNTYCAKCHSPTNWDYSAKIDPPPNCVSCKFPFEPEPRVAKNNVLVSEDEWASIGCSVCHPVDDTIVDPQFAWYDNATGYYETVSTTTELCEKCHRDTQTFIHHKRDLGEEVHTGFTCTDCHDPHDPYASCADKGCHSDIAAQRKLPTDKHVNITTKEQCLVCHPLGMDAHSMEIQRGGEKNCLVCHDYLANISPDDLAPVEHSSIHSLVECVACHDGSGLTVGPVEGEDTWTTFRTIESPLGSVTEPFKSHNLQIAGECGRCHFKDNPWEIAETVDSSK